MYEFLVRYQLRRLRENLAFVVLFRTVRVPCKHTSLAVLVEIVEI